MKALEEIFRRNLPPDQDQLTLQQFRRLMPTKNVCLSLPTNTYQCIITLSCIRLPVTPRPSSWSAPSPSSTATATGESPWRNSWTPCTDSQSTARPGLIDISNTLGRSQVPHTLPFFFPCSSLPPRHGPSEKLVFLFKIYDIDGDGRLQRGEMEAVMRACVHESGMELPESDVVALADALYEEAAGRTGSAGGEGGGGGGGGELAYGHV